MTEERRRGNRNSPGVTTRLEHWLGLISFGLHGGYNVISI